MKKKIATYVLAAGILINSIFTTNVFATSGTTFLLVANKDSVKVGEEFTVTLRGENLKDLYGYEEVIKFDPNKLEFKDAKPLESDCGFPIKKTGLDEVKFAYTQIGSKPGKNDNQDLCTVTFIVRAEGKTDIVLRSVEVVNSNVTSEVYDLDKIISINKEITPNKPIDSIKSTDITKSEKSAEVKETVDKIVTERIFGSNRIETAINISKSGWINADSVVLANAYDFPDALAGTAYAYMKNAPILLSTNDKIDDTVIREIKRLKASNVYILGGLGAISKDVENVLIDNGIKVIRFQGKDRYETSVKIGEQVINSKYSDTVFLAYGNNFPDALSASTFAASKGYPILFTETDILNKNTEKALSNWNIKKVFILGGTGIISSDVENSLTNMGIFVERQGGQDRYDTAMKVVKRFSDGNIKGLTIASGQDFPDALSGSVLAAKNNAPIVIYNKTDQANNVEEFIKTTVKNKKLYIIGGQGTLPQKDIESVIK